MCDVRETFPCTTMRDAPIYCARLTMLYLITEDRFDVSYLCFKGRKSSLSFQVLFYAERV